MRKAAIITLSALALFAGACKKKDTTTTTPVTPLGLKGPYFFNFKLNDSTFSIDGSQPQYIALYANECGGYQSQGKTLVPCAWLSFTRPYYDTISESQIMALKGKTIYFDDTLMHPKVGYDYDLAGYAGWESVDTADHNFYVTISDITYTKLDTALTTPVRAYTIKGTCNALVQRNGMMKVMSAGDFYFLIARQDH